MCGCVILIMKARSMQWQNFPLSSTAAVFNHFSAFGVHPRLLKVYFNFCGTYTSSWASDFSLRLSKYCKNLAPYECFSFTTFVTVPWECPAPCCTWLSKFFVVHELDTSPDYHLQTSVVLSLHSLEHSGGRQLSERANFFNRFSHFDKTWVANRVSFIHETSTTCNITWRHCPGSMNRADLLSRGATIQELLKVDWLHQGHF